MSKLLLRAGLPLVGVVAALAWFIFGSRGKSAASGSHLPAKVGRGGQTLQIDAENSCPATMRVSFESLSKSIGQQPVASKLGEDSGRHKFLEHRCASGHGRIHRARRRSSQSRRYADHAHPHEWKAPGRTNRQAQRSPRAQNRLFPARSFRRLFRSSATSQSLDGLGFFPLLRARTSRKSLREKDNVRWHSSCQEA